MVEKTKLQGVNNKQKNLARDYKMVTKLPNRLRSSKK